MSSIEDIETLKSPVLKKIKKTQINMKMQKTVGFLF